MSRLHSVSLLVIAALALSSCGDDGGDGGMSGRAEVERFTPAQFAAIEQVYVEARRFEQRGGSAKRRTPAALDVALRPLLTACGRSTAMTACSTR